MEKQQPDVHSRSNEGARIPLSLQAVFLSGNRGQEVNTPPPDASAMKLFTVHSSNAQGSSRWPPFRSWSSIATFSRNAIAPVSVSTETDTKITIGLVVEARHANSRNQEDCLYLNHILGQYVILMPVLPCH